MGVYDQDGLYSTHNHDFMADEHFCKAYARGVRAVGRDYQWHWRVHIGLWVATAASKLDGDFVECGVNRGFLSSAIMEHLNWSSIGKKFYLMDTFKGIDARLLTNDELAQGVLNRNKTDFYTDDASLVKENFSEWENVEIVEGSIPETLPLVDAEKVAYLHIDMNCSAPEVAALNYFWDRLVSGALVLLDDYAYCGYEGQKRAMDVVAKEKGFGIVSLPTGQGLLIKPPNEAG